ncbi:HalD/BesD family halogenase [Streptomyces hydrogenans]|uniref:HalD/BesD family halogenase n=1 Tax=Streptomyces hydrogenans TaxID=1873719 RepID=UPI00406BC3A1
MQTPSGGRSSSGFARESGRAEAAELFVAQRLATCRRAALLRALDSGRARAAHHRAGDAYLLRGDTTAHRVTPLARPHRTSSATELYG